MSYLSGQIAHDLRIQHKYFLRFMPSASGLLNELPNIHALVAELKVAKPWSSEATVVEKKNHVHSRGSLWASFASEARIREALIWHPRERFSSS